MTIIDVRHLKFSYKDKKLFDNVSFSVQNNSWNSFYGLNRCGKTTLCNILSGKIKADGYININRKYLCNETYPLLKKDVFLVSLETCEYFAADNLYNELILSGESSEIIDEYLLILNLDEYKNKPFNDLSIDKKIITSILYGILIKSKIFLLDNVLCYLKNTDKEKIFNLLKNYVVCNFTSNPEELLFSDNVTLMNDNFRVCESSNIAEISIIDLCLKLKCYGLIEKENLDIDTVINSIWKI